MPPVYNQGNLGSCTANALAALIQYDDPKPGPGTGSRLFIYYNERRLEGDIPDDAGAYLHDGITTLERYGVCPETLWPYILSKFAVKPPDSCYTSAASHRALAAQTIPNDIIAMKNALVSGFPFCVGIMVFPEFVSARVAATGVVPMPSRGQNPLGGHAVVVVGYDDRRQVWILRNSWGATWGDHGHFTLPYPYLVDPVLSSDMWMITRVG